MLKLRNQDPIEYVNAFILFTNKVISNQQPELVQKY